MKYYPNLGSGLSDADVESLVQAAVASNRLEGMETPLDEIEMLRKFASGQVSESEYMDWVWARVGVKDSSC